MECFVEDLLSYNMIKSGAFKLNPVDFDPWKVLEFIKETFQEKFRQKNLQISVEFIPKLRQEERKERPRLQDSGFLDQVESSYSNDL